MRAAPAAVRRGGGAPRYRATGRSAERYGSFPLRVGLGTRVGDAIAGDTAAAAAAAAVARGRTRRRADRGARGKARGSNRTWHSTSKAKVNAFLRPRFCPALGRGGAATAGRTVPAPGPELGKAVFPRRRRRPRLETRAAGSAAATFITLGTGDESVEARARLRRLAWRRARGPARPPFPRPCVRGGRRGLWSSATRGLHGRAPRGGGGRRGTGRRQKALSLKLDDFDFPFELCCCGGC